MFLRLIPYRSMLVSQSVMYPPDADMNLPSLYGSQDRLTTFCSSSYRLTRLILLPPRSHTLILYIFEVMTILGCRWFHLISVAPAWPPACLLTPKLRPRLLILRSGSIFRSLRMLWPPTITSCFEGPMARTFASRLRSKRESFSISTAAGLVNYWVKVGILVVAF
jgi:hypothetical protein